MVAFTMEQFLSEVQDGQIFRATFVKKGDGETRTMICRRGVKKGVKGVLPEGHRAAEDARCHVLTVFDMQKRDPKTKERGVFRRISLDNLISVRLHRCTYEYDAGTNEFALSAVDES